MQTALYKRSSSDTNMKHYERKFLVMHRGEMRAAKKAANRKVRKDTSWQQEDILPERQEQAPDHQAVVSYVAGRFCY